METQDHDNVTQNVSMYILKHVELDGKQPISILSSFCSFWESLKAPLYFQWYFGWGLIKHLYRVGVGGFQFMRYRTPLFCQRKDLQLCDCVCPRSSSNLFQRVGGTLRADLGKMRVRRRGGTFCCACANGNPCVDRMRELAPFGHKIWAKCYTEILKYYITSKCM